MDVDDAALHGAADLVGEDLHVAGQDDEFHLFGGDQVEELALRLAFVSFVTGMLRKGTP